MTKLVFRVTTGLSWSAVCAGLVAKMIIHRQKRSQGMRVCGQTAHVRRLTCHSAELH